MVKTMGGEWSTNKYDIVKDGSGNEVGVDIDLKFMPGQHGHHYKDGGGTLQKQEALLKDTPQLPGRGANATQIFESTAVALEGTQTNTYYGSVQWGWLTDAAGKFTKLPLSFVTNGVPTTTS